MLTSKYMTSIKNLPAILDKIIEGTAPDKFTHDHLKSIGFKSSNDVGVLGLLKELGFLSSDGVPTKRYHAYRDKSQSEAVMAEAIREAYEELFHINETPTTADRKAIEGKFKSVHNATDRVAAEQAKTFFALLKRADLNASTTSPAKPDEIGDEDANPKDKTGETHSPNVPRSFNLGGLRYNIEIHLPPTKDVEVFNAIFKSLKEHLLDE